MKKTITSVAIAVTALVAAPRAEAGGYHCKLQINDLKVTADKTYVLKVQKVGQDREDYKKALGDWEMVAEEVGSEFTIIFEIDELDEGALKCLNYMIRSFKEGKAVEFGFGDTARKAAAAGLYRSTALVTFHEHKPGEPCVHGS